MTRALRVTGPLAVLAVLIAAPWYAVNIPVVFDSAVNSPGTLQLLAVCGVYVGLALTYDLLFGYTGLLTFGHALYFAIGVYAFAIATTKWHLAFGLGVAVAAGIGLVAAALIGSVTLRVAGLAFALVGFSVAQIFAVIVVKNPGSLTGGSDGFSLDTTKIPGIFVGVFNTKYLYWLALGYAVLVFAVVRWSVSSSPGRVWQAIRENELRMQVLGLRTYTYKLMCFVLASFLCTLGGIVYVLALSGPDPGTTSADITLSLLIMVVLGGAGTKWGAVMGAVLYTYLDNRLSAFGSSSGVQRLPGYLRVPVSEPKFWLGTMFILVVLFIPRGIGSLGTVLRGKGGMRANRKLASPAQGQEEAGIPTASSENPVA